MSQRVIAYIDGFNLYYGLRSRGWKRLYWVNLQKLAQLLLKPGQVLVHTKYFTSVVNHPAEKNRRQATFLDALRTLDGLSIHYGHFLWETVTCKHCGRSYTAYHEKMTDVNIAVQLLADAFQDRFDVALLISADGDLVGPLKALHELHPTKRIVVVFPPDRYSNALQTWADACLHITKNLLSRSRFPEQVVTDAGITLTCPVEWH